MSSGDTDNRESQDRITFSFGRNWQQFVEQHLDPDGERIAAASLTDFLEREDLRDASFLDIGCGSGLFSLGAYRLGARRVVSVDVDPRSVESTRRLREAVGSPDRWEVLLGSILDQRFVKTLAPADIVYAWGSLHHTGRMWEAIANACSLVSPGGVLYLAIYNKVEGRGSSDYWLKVKKLYNRSPMLAKRIMEVVYVARYHAFPRLVRFRNPFAVAQGYKGQRGMNFWIDVRDWLGGYPYEFAAADEVFRFCTRRHGFSLVNLHSVNNIGLNIFLFRKPA
jgi:SAM-dependent methyltransferase